MGKRYFMCSSQLACAVLLAMTAAQANDSTGYIGTGGVEYLKNKNISMHSEDLYISKDKIRVNYESWIQHRSATHPNLDFTSSGVLNPSTFLGRLFKLSSID